MSVSAVLRSGFAFLWFSATAIAGCGTDSRSGASRPDASKSLHDGAQSPRNGGEYFVFRTLINAAGPTPDQNQQCDQHFGPRAPEVVVRTNALCFAMSADTSTGFISDEQASYVGPGFVCFVPNVANGDIVEGYTLIQIPGVGQVEGHGACELAPGATGAPFIQCRFEIPPRPDLGFLGGYAVSATVSGSVFIAHLFFEPGASSPSVAPPPTDGTVFPLPNDPDFYVFRTFDEQTSSGSPACPDVEGGVVDARSVELSAATADLNNARLMENGDPHAVATGNLCFGRPSTDAIQAIVRSASLRIELTRRGQTVEVIASGHCRELPTGVESGSRHRACSLGVTSSTSPGFQGGMIATNGLVNEGSVGAADSHVWVLALLANPAN